MKRGLYEEPINKSIKAAIELLPDHFETAISNIDDAELPHVLSQVIQREVKKGLQRIKASGKQKVLKQVELTNKILQVISDISNDVDFLESRFEDQAPKQLLAIVDKQKTPTLKAKSWERPATSLSASCLFTGAKSEPSLGSEIAREIESADEIDILMSFIRWSGLRLIYARLDEFTKRGGRLRIITTSYMGATDYKAVEQLSKLSNTTIKVSYDTKRTRLHAKAYIFKRNTGFATAYIGSSNISKAAMEKGLEWNTKLTATDFPSVYEKCVATFETYWNEVEFVEFDHVSKENQKKLKQALQAEKSDHHSETIKFNIKIQPYTYQVEILEELAAERELYNNYSNLLVAATGTGKTMISAFDYKQFCRQEPRAKNRLLFVAHRKEILEQSRVAFRAVLNDWNFGELLVGEYKANEYDHLFVSVQSLNSKNLIQLLTADYYDFIIIDEFHHTAASSYLSLLKHFKPQILLGLTATPERTDGKQQEIIDTYFNGRYSAEIRLPEAIDRRLLVPFNYFGITDSVDYSSLKWARGGYDVNEIEQLYLSANHQRCFSILKSVHEYVTDPREMRAVGFCVSKKHAEYMSEFFNKNGIPSDYLHSGCGEKRDTIQSRLKKREINIIFVVDMYNEGVDLPYLDTILFLRPTESLIVFLQQLGRGLRLDDDKEGLTVLDFVGQAHKNFSYEGRYRALVGASSSSIEQEVIHGFSQLPAGCTINLEKKAKEFILRNISQYFKGGRSRFIERMKTFTVDSGKELTIENFVSFYSLPLATIYKTNTWSELLDKAGFIDGLNATTDPDYKVLSTGLRRSVHINSWKYLNYLLDNWDQFKTIDYDECGEIEQQYLRMFYYSIWQAPLHERGFSDVAASFKQLHKNKNLSKELKEILLYNRSKIRFVERDIKLPYDLALHVHDQYSRDEIISAFMPEILEKKHSYFGVGVIHFKKKKTDIFFVDLNKTEKNYSATTMYNDYAISEKLFHWQSQSTTPVHGKTGQRYLTHVETGHNVLLFVRESKTTNGVTTPYYFLGSVDYKDHHGSKPINITWELHESMPAYIVEKSKRLG